MNAEIETAQAIIDHYEGLRTTIKLKTEELMKRITELTTTVPDIEKRVEVIDKPIEEMHEKLTRQREQKLKELQSHVERTRKFVTKKKAPPRNHTNFKHNHYRTNPYQYQQSRQRNQFRQLPLQQQLQQPKTYAAAALAKTLHMNQVLNK